MPYFSRADVRLEGDTDIVVSRDFAAPRRLVYRAFTQPELVSRWLLGPPGWSMPVCDIDLRVGGRYRYRWRKDDGGEEFGLIGTFDGIEPDVALASREAFEDAGPVGEARVATRFTDHGTATRVVTVISCPSPDARDAALATGMTDGMEQSYAALDRLFAADADA